MHDEVFQHHWVSVAQIAFQALTGRACIPPALPQEPECPGRRSSIPFSRLGVFDAAARFACESAAAIERQRHACLLKQRSPLDADSNGRKLLILLWRRGWDSNPRAGYPTR